MGHVYDHVDKYKLLVLLVEDHYHTVLHDAQLSRLLPGKYTARSRPPRPPDANMTTFFARDHKEPTDADFRPAIWTPTRIRKAMRVVLQPMLQFVLENHFYSGTDGKIFLQSAGAPMGSRLSSCLMNLWLAAWERKFSPAIKERIPADGYFRYMDDTLLKTISNRPEDVDALVHDLNQLDPHVQVTAACPDAATGTLPHLDLQFWIRETEDGTRLPDWCIFRKPMAGPHVGAAWHSATPDQQKHDYVCNEVLRALRNCRLPEQAEPFISQLHDRCLAAGFPLAVVQRQIDRGRRRFEGILHKVGQGLQPRYRSAAYRREHRQPNRGVPGAPFVLWIPRRSNRFRNKLIAAINRSGIPLTVKELSGTPLVNQLFPYRLGPKPTCAKPTCIVCSNSDDRAIRTVCKTEDMVYSVTCLICAEQDQPIHACYGGQTSRPLCDRAKDHHDAARRAATAAPDSRTYRNAIRSSAMGEHFALVHHNVNVQDIKLRFSCVHKTSGSVDRDVLEGITIRRTRRDGPGGAGQLMFNLNRRAEDNGVVY